MKVLQIACGVNYSKVYYKLFSTLKKYNFNFEVYVPQRKNVKNINEDEFPFPFYSNKIIRPYDKFIYFSKIVRMSKDITENFELSKINLIHSHSLFTDGGVAFELFKKYNIPYIVAIRNTDVNKYFKYAFHLRKYAVKIMLNAKKIIFISPSYKKLVIDKFLPPKYKNEISMKSEIIPNGVDDYWLDQKEVNTKIVDKNRPKIIFVGRIDKNKNLKAVIEAVRLLKTEGISCLLNVVGDGPLRASLEEKYIGDKNVVFHGAINNKDKLEQLYMKSDILVVPSFNETFGLVYVEAMSCGVPVIYSKNQGFDGFFPQGQIGYAVNPYNIEEIVKAIDSILSKYNHLSNNCSIASKIFNWNEVTSKYIDIYQTVAR